jgi:uncharacterized repeat protein (TIGR01451 family)/CSLREA domain-containing protein
LSGRSHVARVLSTLVVTATIAASFVLPSVPARAATSAVDCVSNPSTALQAAITGANAGDVLNVSGTCTGNFVIDKTLDLSGTTGATLDAGGSGTTLTINSPAMVTVTGLTISGGSAGNGGGIFNGGILTLTNSTVSGNSAPFSGGATGAGGGIFSDNGTTLTLTKSTVSGNTADTGGGIFSGGTLTLTNSTVSGNTAFDGGGIFNEGSGGGTAGITNSTVSGNTANGGGGGIRGNGTWTWTASIIAANPAGSDCFLEGASTTDGGYNLSSDSSCGFSGTSLSGVNPLLGPLRNNGGATKTMSPGSGSPAVDAIPSGNAACPAHDQRGLARPVGSGCDIGAVERALIVNSTGDTPDSTAGNGVCNDGTGQCTLRAAIQESNALAGVDAIAFDIPGSYSNAAPATILPASALPSVQEPTSIDGTTQAGSACPTAGAPATLLVRVDGTSAGSVSGLTLGSAAAGSTLQGLRVSGFQQYGVELNGATQTLRCSYIESNKFAGLKVAGSGATVGGNSPADRNVISANDNGVAGCCSDGFGINVLSAGGGTTIAGNYIGTDPTGLLDAGNKSFGVNVAAANVTVGGTTNASRNVIAGNNWSGVNVGGGTATQNVRILNNYIGFDKTGSGALINTNQEVILNGSGTGNVIGAPGQGNIIGGGGAGVVISLTSGATVQANSIGLGADGTSTSRPANGVHLSSGVIGATIGGTGPGEGNVIGATAGNEVVRIQGGNTTQFQSINNLVAGNYIGTNPAGTVNIGGGIGVGIQGTLVDNNTIGAAAAPNIIKNNTTAGVSVGGGTGNTIRFNEISANGNGVAVYGTTTTTVGPGNTIWSNSSTGVYLAGSTGATITGNTIGLRPNGSNAGNAAFGIQVAAHNTQAPGLNNTGTVIGGTGAGDGNVVVNNSYGGIWLGNVGPVYVSNALVQGNRVGLTASDAAAPNGGGSGAGIAVDGDGGNHDITLGGTAPGAANIVANNFRGITLGTTTTPNVRIKISGNSVSNSTGGLGIDLGTAGVTPNDALDADTGANHLQNFPVLANANNNGSNTTVGITLDSTPSTQFSVELFSSPSCDASGNGEGSTYLDSVSVTTDGSGHVATPYVYTGLVPIGHVLTATATVTTAGASQGDTSEFSACATVAGVVPNDPDLRVTQIDNGPKAVGQNLTYTITVENVGTGNATGISLADTLPAGVTFVSATPGAGDGTCSGGNFPCLLTDLAPTETAVVTLVVTPTRSGTKTNVATVTSTGDVNAANDSSSHDATATAPTGVVTLTVNSTGDGSDATPGDGACETAADNGVCTLRAAVEEANALPDHDLIHFNIAGAGSHTIAIASQIEVTDPVTVDGTTQAGHALLAPTIHLDGGGSTFTSMRVGPGADGSTIEGIESSGFVVGLLVDYSANNTLSDNYTHDNTEQGILVYGNMAHDNVIDGNLSSHNVGPTIANGIAIGGGAYSNIVRNNLVGTNAAGTAADGNGKRGIEVHGAGSFNQIGPGNVISGNGIHGVLVSSITGGGPTRVFGNKIGTDITGTIAIPNGTGVQVVNAPDTVIGGATSGDGNLISGNTGDGVLFANDPADAITGPSANSSISNNVIGEDATGSSLPNGGWGVQVGDANSNITVGGTAGLANTIANNGTGGVAVTGSATRVSIRKNAIYANGGLGIDLGTDGRTNNDAGVDGDTGPNGLQNWPTIAAADAPSGDVTISLNSLANTTFDIDVYSAPTCATINAPDARALVGSSTLTTNGSGAGSHAFNFLGSFAVGDRLTATATDPLGNTSEFGDCVTATTPGGADLSVTQLDTPDPVIAGDDVTYTVTVTNNGPVTATGVSLINTLSGNISAATGTWNTGSCDPFAAGVLTCDLGDIANSGSVQVTIVATTDGTGSTATNTASATSGVTDPAPANNTAIVSTTTIDPRDADLVVSQDHSPAAAYSGGDVTYTVTVTNNGPDASSRIDLSDTLPTGSTLVGSIAVAPTGTSICTPGSNSFTCDLDPLASGASADVTFTVRTSTAFPQTATNSVDAVNHQSSGVNDASAPNTSTHDVVLSDANPGFAPAVHYVLNGNGAFWAATGDIDHANGPDVAVSGNNTKVTILRNDGSGAFTQTTETFAAGTTTWLALGDVNNDGNADLAVVTAAGTIKVRLSAGDGTFNTTATLSVGSNEAAGIAIGDVTGDGKADLVAALSDSVKDVAVFAGAGDGTFAAPDKKGGTGGQYGVAIGDIDGDGINDVVTTSPTETRAFIATGANNPLNAPVIYPLAGSATPWPTLADVNNDNFLDIAVSGATKPLLNDGDGTFTASASDQFVGGAGALTFFAHGDFNGDGQIDVESAVSRSGQTAPEQDLFQFVGAGNGTFSAGDGVSNVAHQHDASTPMLTATNLEGAAHPEDDLIVVNGAAAQPSINVLFARATPAITGLTFGHTGADTIEAGYQEIPFYALDLSGGNVPQGLLESASGPVDMPARTAPGSYPGRTAPGSYPGRTSPGGYPGKLASPGSYPGRTSPGGYPGKLPSPGGWPAKGAPGSYPARSAPGSYPVKGSGSGPGTYPIGGYPGKTAPGGYPGKTSPGGYPIGERNAAFPLSSVPLKALVDHQIANPPSLTQISLDLPNGWAGVLAGTALANEPIQQLTLNDVIGSSAWSGFRNTTLDHISFGSDSIGSLPPAAFFFGETKLSQIHFTGAYAWTGGTGDDGNLLREINETCDTPISETDLSQTLVDIAVAKCPMWIVPWNSVSLKNVTGLSQTTAPLYGYLLSGIAVNGVRFDRGGTPTSLGALALDQVPDGVVDCTDLQTGPGCLNTHTLGEMQAAETASDTILEPDSKFGQLWAGGNTVIGNMTLGDLLLGIYPAGSFPFDRIPIENLVDATDPAFVDSIGYDASFDVACPAPATIEVRATFPSARFRYVPERTVETPTPHAVNPNTFTFGGGSPVDAPTPTLDDTNTLTWQIPADACSTAGPAQTVTFHFEVTVPPDTGVQNVSFAVSADTGGTLRTTDAITTTEVGGTDNNSVSDNTPEVFRDSLVLGQFDGNSDVNYYKIPVTTADVDALVIASMSSVNNDNDLVMYGNTPQNLSAGAPVGDIAARGIGDREGCLPQGFALETETLDNVPLLPASAGYAVRSFSTARENPLEVTCTVVEPEDAARGYILLQASHYLGDPEPLSPAPYMLSVTFDRTSDSTSCDDLHTKLGATGTPAPDDASTTLAGQTVPTGTKTLFLINADRYGDLYGSAAETSTLAALRSLAGRTEIAGQIVPVDSSGAVNSAYAALTGVDACSPTVRNKVVKAISTLVGQVTSGRTAPEYVVIVGDDDIIPFARLKDLASLGNQFVYAPEVQGRNGTTPVNNPVSKAFSRGYFLSDDPYGTFTEPFPWGGNLIYVPDASVARLVETPSEIQGQIDQYLASNGLLDPKTALTTGADTANNVASEIDSSLAARAASLNNETQDIEILDAASGTFTLTFDGQTTGPIAFDASANDVENALIALSNVGATDVTVGGLEGGPWRVEFTGGLANQNLAPMTADTSGLDVGATANINTFHNGNPATQYGTNLLRSNADGPWTRADLLCRLDGFNHCGGTSGPAPGIWSVNGHFSHRSTLNGDGNADAQTLTSDFRGTGVPLGTIMFTIGCNSGVSVPDSYFSNTATVDDDWAQELSGKAGILVGNQGFGYGDLSRLAYSEKLMRLFSANLDGSFRIGPALTEAKGDYWTSLTSFSPYDVKAMEESIFYGLPWYRITGNATPETHVAPALRDDPDTGLPSSVVTYGTQSNPFVDPGDEVTAPNNYGTYFLGQKDGGIEQTTNVVGQPIQPLSRSTFMTQDGLRLQGALVTTLKVSDIVGSDPTISVVGMDGGSTTPPAEPQISTGTWPTDFVTIHHVQGDDSIKAYGGRFTFTGADLGTQRLYGQMKLRAFYAPPSSTDTTAPTVNASGIRSGTGPSTIASFTVKTSGDATDAYVLYRTESGPDADTFQLLHLGGGTLSGGLRTFSGSVNVGNNGVAEFFGEAVDGAGNVGFDTFKGANQALTDASTIVPPAGVYTTVVPDGYPADTSTPNQVAGWYTEPVKLRIRTPNGAISAGVVPNALRNDWPIDPFYGYNSAIVDIPDADGSYQVDYVGGLSSGSSFLQIDANPPVLGVDISTPQSGVNPVYVSPTTPVNVTVTDKGSGVGTCSIDVTAPDGVHHANPCGGGSNPVLLVYGDGEYAVSVSATDNVGHATTTAFTFSLRKDSVAPTTASSFSGPAPSTFVRGTTTYVRSNTNVNFVRTEPNLTDGKPGSGYASCAASIRFRGNAPTTLTCTGTTQSYTVNGSDGDYTISTSATDNVQNTSGTTDVRVRLDNTAPTVAHSVSSGPSYTNGGSTFVTKDSQIRATVADPSTADGPGSGVRDCTRQITAGTVGAGAVALTPNTACEVTPVQDTVTDDVKIDGPDGTYTVTTTAHDNLGNTTANGGSTTYTLDNTAPIFGACPVPNPGISGNLVTGIAAGTSGSSTTFQVDESATSPRAPFLITITTGGNTERLTVTKKTLVTGYTNRYTYTATRNVAGSTGTVKPAHTVGDGVTWAPIPRMDQLGWIGQPTKASATSPPTYTTITGGQIATATQTTFRIYESRFGVPQLPFTIQIDDEQMVVTNRVQVSGNVFTLTATRGTNGTTPAAHTNNASNILWVGGSVGKVTALSTSSISIDQDPLHAANYIRRFQTAPSAPFDIWVNGEQITVLRDTTASATATVRTYDVLRGVNATTGAVINKPAVLPAVTATYVNGPSASISMATTDDAWRGPDVAESGLATPATLTTTFAPGSNVGTFPVTFTATDNVGNSATKTCTYEVLYKLTGFLSPIVMDTVNSQTPGQGIAVKWRITDYLGNNVPGVTDAASSFVEVTTSYPSTGSTCTMNPEPAVDDQQFKGASNLQNSGNGNWQFNWATQKGYATQCRTMKVRLAQPGLSDSTMPSLVPSRSYQYAIFQFKAK